MHYSDAMDEKSELLCEIPVYHSPRCHKRSTFAQRRPFLRIGLVVLSLFLILVIFRPSHKHRASLSIPSSDAKAPDFHTLGLALTPTYGTIAVRNQTGGLLVVAKVEGNEGYVKMMKKLSRSSAKHPSCHISPPYRSLGESIVDWPRQALRHARKGVGLPASHDVGRLANMIKDLKRAAFEQIGQHVEVSGAILAPPSILAIYEEDACDALHYLKVHDLVGTHIVDAHPRAISAAFSGYGFGACEHWKDAETCSQERMEFPLSETLLLDYSRGALSIDMDRLRFPWGYRFYDSHHPMVDFEAGSNSKLPGDDDIYWERITHNIQTAIEQRGSQTIDLVLISGESTQEPKFEEVVQKAVKKYGNPKIQLSDPVFVAAKGASDLAWKAAEIQRMFPKRKYHCMGPR